LVIFFLNSARKSSGFFYINNTSQKKYRHEFKKIFIFAPFMHNKNYSLMQYIMNKFGFGKLTGVIVILSLLHSGLTAQEVNDAIKAFNASVELMKVDNDAAIVSFEDCIKICEQVGDSAFEIQYKAEQVLPGLYYQKASNLLTVDKNIQEALVVARKTLQVAEKYDNQVVAENSRKIMIQAYSDMASAFLKQKENEKAIQAYDSLLMINPDHLTALYNKALVCMAIKDNQKFEEAIDMYIAKLKETGDSQKTEQANKMALDYFRIAGGKANQANKLTDALSFLNTATKYGADKNVYYHFASIYNKQKKYSMAEENAQKGLVMETGSAEEKAKFYYELGVAQAGLGETNNACTSFKNSMYGPFVEASKGQRTNLKCQ
jgi:tetratricopeptide (TPR) repeat protein